MKGYMYGAITGLVMLFAIYIAAEIGEKVNERRNNEYKEQRCGK